MLNREQIKTEEDILEEVHNSHISYNVASESNFKKFLQRDLNEYFNIKSKDSEVTYELLRDWPTQTGVGFPHFYLWVKVRLNGNPLSQGAIRTSAVEGKSFYIEEFISAAQIRANPDLPDTIFPKSLCETIRQRAANAELK